MSVIKSTYRVDNGSGWDEHMLKTLAEQVFMKDGTNLEDGFTKSLGQSGYTKLPNGMIIQWGRKEGKLYNGRGVVEGPLPITFPAYGVIVTSLEKVDYSAEYTGMFGCNGHLVNNGYFNAHIENLKAAAGFNASIFYLAMGW